MRNATFVPFNFVKNIGMMDAVNEGNFDDGVYAVRIVKAGTRWEILVMGDGEVKFNRTGNMYPTQKEAKFEAYSKYSNQTRWYIVNASENEDKAREFYKI